MIVLPALLLAGNALAASVSFSVAADTAAATGSETKIVYRPAVEPAGSRL